MESGIDLPCIGVDEAELVMDGGRDWAQAALRDYEACENADQEIVDTLKLLEQIESRLRGTSPPS
jgi:hypothetical protein